MSSLLKILRWEVMEVGLSFLVLRLFVILCVFSIHGSADAGGHAASDAVSPAVSPGFSSERHGHQIAAPHKSSFYNFPHSFNKAPTLQDSRSPSPTSFAPSKSPFRHIPRERTNSLGPSHANSYSEHHHHHHSNYHARNQYGKSSAGPSYPPSLLPYGHQFMRPAYELSPSPSPYSSTMSRNSPGPAPSSRYWQSRMPIHPPHSVSPSSSTFVLPSPPPNQDCTTITCVEPMTYTPSGIPCGCVWPMHIKLQLSIDLYIFFPLVSKLAAQIASSLFLNQSQVRITGANTASQEPEKTVVLINLVPLTGIFKHADALSMYKKFWHKEIHVNSSLFGSYDVLDVHYPGLPSSPSSLSSNLAATHDHPYPANYKGNSGSSLKPLGVDVPRRQKNASDRSVLAVIIVSVITALLTCAGIAWILIARHRCSAPKPEEALSTAVSSFSRPSGDTSISGLLNFVQTPRLIVVDVKLEIFGHYFSHQEIYALLVYYSFSWELHLESSIAYNTGNEFDGTGPIRSLALGSKSLSGSLSLASGMLSFTGSAKNFSLSEIEKATDGFDTSRILGEGGFGIVYMGNFDDGDQVAVKVLKRDKRHGISEFLSEVEMLSRLHHKNLVKLLGICTEEQTCCLVYELVPNGSVESHLHGADKEVVPLDWATRVRIALGAARGLAYLHEDSNPCVIHRDFKSSNILLEHDFTPKVSDFGLARNALNEGNQPISTHVIGTFGYLAPEYAMTGHLLVKSDVYSYGVVLLELLTGRKPIDFSKPPGQENLVAWALPLLTSKEGLEIAIDPVLKPCNDPFDSFFKVAAIASMCVQPEVSRRPFMGEVVQALKLVCSELDDANVEGLGSDSFSLSKVSMGEDNKSDRTSAEFQIFFGTHNSTLSYESNCDAKVASSVVDLASVSTEFAEKENNFSERNCSSGPLGSAHKKSFWHKLGQFSRGSVKEHLWTRSH